MRRLHADSTNSEVAMRSGQDIRREFIEFFQNKDHRFVPSSSLLPADDPTLLFTNAGMNQFKPIFLGTETRDYVRACNSQKCIRAGGKHNDLEDVGRDTYHHTLFEMLGNWSFGDYFKAEAIAWAWELLTEVWGLDKSRLHVTVFEGDASEDLQPDDEARRLWAETTDIDPSHIHNGNKKDNFWEMGDTGPCGPCSEIHIDLTEERTGAGLINADDPRVIEIWNLVFIQYNRSADGKLSSLPAKHVDTGMGLERVAAVLQGKKTNYATDLFVPIIEKIETLTDHRYGSATGAKDRFDTADARNMGDVACRVLADHARALTFAIADGILPSNDGRGYVLRRILRRACRYGRQYLHIEGLFIGRLVEVVVELMGEAYPELRQRKQAVLDIIKEEEESFGRTLDRGIELFDRQAEKLRSAGQTELSGQTAFDLYATYGFPVDLTVRMAEEEGLSVDMAGYEAAMEEHAEKSRGGAEKFKVDAIVGLPPTDDSAKYSPGSLEASLLGWVVDGSLADTGRLEAGDEAILVFDRTCFYAEQGGQVGDSGQLSSDTGHFEVTDVKVAGQSVLHIGRIKSGYLEAGQKVTMQVGPDRIDTMRNHSATHLLNWALRKVLGDGIDQAGSVVDPDRMRFDFTYPQAVAAEKLAEVEKHVNQFVLADAPIGATVMPLEEARKVPGVRAVFGEKYPDPVRVITMGVASPAAISQAGTCSVEFCGGTHLQRTGQVGLFKIVGEESVAKGVRRITALTGRAAVEWVQQADAVINQLTGTLKTQPAELPERVAAMQKQIKELKKKPAPAATNGMEVVASCQTASGKVLIGKVAHTDADTIRGLCDQHRQKGAAALLIGGTDGQKVTLIAMVSDELAKSGALKAGDWVKDVAKVVGGGGGGRPTLAQAGGKQPEKLDQALAQAGQFAEQKLQAAQ
ncbi:MAG: alanine--tRNA ligase [Phycisphaerae bacterium]